MEKHTTEYRLKVTREGKWWSVQVLPQRGEAKILASSTRQTLWEALRATMAQLSARTSLDGSMVVIERRIAHRADTLREFLFGKPGRISYPDGYKGRNPNREGM